MLPIRNIRSAFEDEPEFKDGKDFYDYLYCGIDAIRTEGCQEPTNCSYPISAWNRPDCTVYVSCSAKSGGDGMTGRFAMTYCSQGQEFSNITKSCGPAGTPGTCSEKNQVHQLAVRAAVSEIGRANTTSDGGSAIGFKCCVEAKNGTCIEPLNRGLFTHPKDCQSYIECVPDTEEGLASKEGKALIKYCPPDEEDRPSEWNRRTFKCDWAGAPGTCSGRPIRLTTASNAPGSP
jgi:hypothetical protein